MEDDPDEVLVEVEFDEASVQKGVLADAESEMDRRSGSLSDEDHNELNRYISNLAGEVDSYRAKIKELGKSMEDTALG